MRSLKLNIIPVLALCTLALMACGKKKASSADGSTDPSSVSSSSTWNPGGLYNAGSSSALPCNGAYQVALSGSHVTWACPDIAAYNLMFGSNSNAMATANPIYLLAGDTLTFTPDNSNKESYTIYYQSGGGQGPIAISGVTTISASQNEAIIFGKQSASGFLSSTNVNVKNIQIQR